MKYFIYSILLLSLCGCTSGRSFEEPKSEYEQNVSNKSDRDMLNPGIATEGSTTVHDKLSTARGKFNY